MKTPQLDLFRRGRSGPRGWHSGPAPLLALIAPAIIGDRATLYGADRSWLAPRCGETATAMLGCLSCRQPLASLTQLLLHLECAPDQTHVIARECREHGWETL
jgi:hypothetical protein